VKYCVIVVAIWTVCFGSPADANPIGDFFANLFPHHESDVPLPPVRPRHRKHRVHHRRVASNFVLASYYGDGEVLASNTASGEPFVAGGMTAAHRSLPFGTRVSVCYQRCVVVRVNDRGPAESTGRDLDLALGAARVIGLDRVGVARVRTTILE
jgi:rare lipoprotein A